jgi:hypothetical protein
MIGLPCRACAFCSASVRMGELSVRIVVPMDMKNLDTIISDHGSLPTLFLMSRLPKRRCRTQHVLTQCPQHAVGPWAVSYNVRCAEDEADYQTHSCMYVSVHIKLLTIVSRTASQHCSHPSYSQLAFNPFVTPSLSYLCQMSMDRSCHHRRQQVREAS